MSLPQQNKRISEIYVAIADITAGIHRRGLLPIVCSRRAIPRFGMRLGVLEIAAEGKLAITRATSIAATLGFL